MLRSLYWYQFSDVSGHPISPILKGQAVFLKIGQLGSPDRSAQIRTN